MTEAQRRVLVSFAELLDSCDAILAAIHDGEKPFSPQRIAIERAMNLIGIAALELEEASR